MYTNVKDSGILLTVRYLCEARNRRTSENLIWEDILRSFLQEDDINFAYPTQRLYLKELSKYNVMGNRSNGEGIKGGDEDV